MSAKATGFWNPGMTNPSRNPIRRKTKGHSNQNVTNSAGRSFRSARASSVLRRAERSWPSMTREMPATMRDSRSSSLSAASLCPRAEAYRSSRLETEPPRPLIATPTAMSRMAPAASPAMMKGSVTPGLFLERRSEDVRRQVNTRRVELLHELRPDACWSQPALDLAFDHGRLLEHEDVLHDDDVALHALHLGDVHDLARAILEAVLVDDEVDSGRDLLSDGLQREVHAGHQHHRLETREHVPGRVG